MTASIACTFVQPAALPHRRPRVSTPAITYSLSCCQNAPRTSPHSTKDSLDRKRVSRRSVLVLGTALAASVLSPWQTTAQTDDAVFTLPDLPYAYDALQPYISEQIMRAHHDAHFATYVKNLNKALGKIGNRARGVTDDASLKRLLARLDDIWDTDVRTLLRNNAGGYLNHKQFFVQMAAGGRAPQDGKLARDIADQFGSFDNFQNQFLATATGLFGSGFVWLVKDAQSGRLRISKYANQDNPAMDGEGNIALLGCDCWEHAWYYQYGPKKADYINAWWNVVDWQAVNKLYEA